MSTELELKLALDRRAAARLARHPLLAGVPSRSMLVRDVYYDTDDMALMQRQAALRLRKQDRRVLRTVKAVAFENGALAQRHEWERPGQRNAWNFDDIGDASIRQWLTDNRTRLRPLFNTDFRRKAWQVTYRDAVIEVVYDHGRIACDARQQRFSELELELVSGRPGDLFKFAVELQANLPLRLQAGNKAETGYRLYLNADARPGKLAAPRISPEMSPVTAFRAIALACLDQVLRNQDGCAGAEPEFLHQTRVAMRRLRAALKLFAPALPHDFAKEWNANWRDTSRRFGKARNLDVLLTQILPEIETQFPGDTQVRHLRQQAEKLARDEHQAACAYIASPEHAQTLLRFAGALWELPEADTENLKRFIKRRLKKRLKRIRTFIVQTDRPDSDVRHRLRIAFKNLRYPLESLASLLPVKRSKSYLSALYGMQDHLGRINDHVNALALLASLPQQDAFSLAEGWLAGRHALLCEHLPSSLEDWLREKAFWK